jgi:hypothetical protein
MPAIIGAMAKGCWNKIKANVLRWGGLRRPLRPVVFEKHNLAEIQPRDKIDNYITWT